MVERTLRAFRMQIPGADPVRSLRPERVGLSRNRSQGVPPSVPVVTECEGSRKGAGLEVGFRPNAFSVKKRILANSRLLTCPGIAAAHFQAQ